ncbi:SDR family oxidoreductase [Acidiphilium sp. AL]|uniref:SDR family oxidoreductase n=1 Tax=Acidiphilium iwatense TaxID=768198 RepID=A0ABS9DWV4_9PROT|nr:MULTISPECIES: SDR family NAD(P)-dependent oxidoreductase [Acidiphilium]MCF3946623.1 SDR family oxidoreductase [Acidiphilium iwatense]MCU4159948.1 SDR family oxidoreductase [Acidiphilium sp. AL]
MTDTARFDAKIAVVTGGAAGIGLAVTARIVAEAGRVAIWDRDQSQIDAAKARFGAKILGIAVDVADWDAVEQAASRTAASFGGIDILVASAGITGPNATTWTYPVADWHRVIAVNLNGVFHCNRAVVPFMMQRKDGRIVNIASIAGKEGNPNAPAYSASKAAVIGLTKSLGKELARTGITVNCVTPAAVRTAIFEQMTQEHIDFMLSKIPMGRFGTIDEIAALICWLASEECSFTTGGVFDISGGRATY